MQNILRKKDMFDISITDNTSTELTKFCLENVEKRIVSKCNIFEDYIRNIKVKISKSDKNSFSVKMIVVMTNKKDIITAVSVKEDLFEAVDDVRNKIYIQVEKIKGKYISKRGKDNPVDISPVEEETNLQEEVVKIKTRDVKPMLLEEAIEQMKLLKHDFFIYLDADTNFVNVLYKRKEGNYGLIETVITNN